jgi:radical SAM protein with 4Fe4S-binding SPASM domain
MKNTINMFKNNLFNRGNFLGQVGFGSFASVGQNTTPLADGTCRYYLSLELGQSCQLNCRHCIYNLPEAEDATPQEDILANVTNALDNGFDPLWISLAGKEPTFYDKTLVRIAGKTKRPRRQNIVMTNGLRLNGSLLEQLADNVDYFDISLDGTETAHDWMRGPGRFKKTWANIKEVLEKTECNIGLIATAVHATLQNGQSQIAEIVELAQLLASEYGINKRISLSVSLYYGWPDDPMLLNAGEIADLARSLSEISFPSRLLITANYSSVFPEVASLLGIKERRPEFDQETGLPVMRFGNTSFILFNLSPTLQLGLRIANHGGVYLGCNHLVLGDRAERFKVADLRHDDLQETVARLLNNEVELFNQVMRLPMDCQECSGLSLCGGGDSVSGVYFNGQPADPFCGNIH